LEKIMESSERKAELALIATNADRLTAIASELFGRTTVEVRPDPEIEDSHYVVFSVETSGDPREVANRRREWYRRTATILGDHCGKVQLLIDITE
jgi:hypothetical protein